MPDGDSPGEGIGDGIREPMIGVVIADDHPVVRQGLRTFLASRPGIRVLGEAADAAETIAAVAALRPDVLLLDLVMPGAAGTTTIERVAAEHPEARVLVLTSFAGSGEVLAAVRAGAAGYLLKDVTPGELEQAIRAVHRGEGALHPRATAQVMAAVADMTTAGDRRLGALTPREREVLRLLAAGRSNRELARELGVAEKTVKTHVSSILTKLGVADRTQAAVLAVRAGLARPEDGRDTAVQGS